jgi:hypothetical protein
MNVMDKLNLLCPPEERLTASRITIAAAEA